MPDVVSSLNCAEVARNEAMVQSVENAMFAAGMALEQGNQAQFQSIIDPATDRPFTYTQTANGFKLGSTLLKKFGSTAPVTLSFSTAAAK